MIPWGAWRAGRLRTHGATGAPGWLGLGSQVPFGAWAGTERSHRISCQAKVSSPRCHPRQAEMADMCIFKVPRAGQTQKYLVSQQSSLLGKLPTWHTCPAGLRGMLGALRDVLHKFWDA